MEIQYAEFEEKLIIVINNQRVEITPFRLKEEHGNIKFSINAPRGIGVDNVYSIFNGSSVLAELNENRYWIIDK